MWWQIGCSSVAKPREAGGSIYERIDFTAKCLLGTTVVRCHIHVYHAHNSSVQESKIKNERIKYFTS